MGKPHSGPIYLQSVGHALLGLVQRVEPTHYFVFVVIWKGDRQRALSGREVLDSVDEGKLPGAWRRGTFPSKCVADAEQHCQHREDYELHWMALPLSLRFAAP